MDALVSLINSYLPEPHASLLNGILLGRDLFVPTSFYNKLKVVGLIHIVVLSGMNITMLSGMILQSIIPLCGRRIATILAVVGIIAFITFVGIEPPLIRAGIMGILSLIGLLFGRKTLAIYTLILTSIIMIIIWREWITSISFQLSFAATLGIILFGNVNPEEQKKSHPDPPAGGEGSRKNNTLDSSPAKRDQNDKVTIIKEYLVDELRISLAAQFFTLPIIFFYFRQISFVSPIANILVGWTIAPVMILGIITIVFGMINWHAGFVVSWLCYGILEWIILVIETLAKIPFASIQL